MSDYLWQKNISITFVNAPGHVNQELMEKAANFYAATLMPRLRRKINVTVLWTYSQTMKCRADVELDDTENPRNFTIRLYGKNRGWTVYQFLAHEFVHIKQWVTGDLIDISANIAQWKGKRQRWNNTSIRYWDLPWEIEAMGLESGLYAKFKAYYGLTCGDLKAQVRSS